MSHAEDNSRAEQRPMLEQRFSWETPHETVASRAGQSGPSTATPSSHPAQRSLEPAESPQTIKASGQTTRNSRPGSAQAAPIVSGPDTLRYVEGDVEVSNPTPSGTAFGHRHNSSDGSNSQLGKGRPQASGVISSQRELPFREILALTSPHERIQAYNTSRGVLAATDIGLGQWLQSIWSQSPENSNIFASNGRLPNQEADSLSAQTQSPSRSKFPRDANQGPYNQQSNVEGYDGSKSFPSSSSGGRAGSQPAQKQGRKLLQSASKMGGQAGDAAKGFFTKGKNKLRTSGGGDKVANYSP